MSAPENTEQAIEALIPPLTAAEQAKALMAAVLSVPLTDDQAIALAQVYALLAVADALTQTQTPTED